MKPRFEREQRVTIRSVKNQNYQPKYPQIEQYAGENGTIVESYTLEASKSGNAIAESPHLSGGHSFYRVRIDIQNALVTVPEEALEPFDFNEA